MLKTENIPYFDEGQALEGYAAYATTEKRPLVILCHAWAGRDHFICQKAKDLASLGYTAFALDMYGKGVLGKSKEENAALKKPFVEDRLLLRRKLLKGYEVACSFADTKKIAVVGFGFGGLCALDLARSGVDLEGAVSIYGHFESPHFPTSPIQAKILILHGYHDPISPMSEYLHFAEELNRAKVDWQSRIYGNSYHAFANPMASDRDSGILYNEMNAKRAWREVELFLSEIME